MPSLKLPFRLEFDNEQDRWNLPPEYEQHLAGMYGVENLTLALNLFSGLIHSYHQPEKGNSLSGTSPNQANAFMIEMQPGNPVESLLLSQMMSIHQHTMMTASRLTHSKQVKLMESYTRQMNQLARTFTTQVDALHKLRNGGKQTVQVLYQHVQADPGSQVMVGQQAKA